MLAVALAGELVVCSSDDVCVGVDVVAEGVELVAGGVLFVVAEVGGPYWLSFVTSLAAAHPEGEAIFSQGLPFSLSVDPTTCNRLPGEANANFL